MRQDNVRDYATDAFRFWAAVGGAEAFRERIRTEAMRDSGDGGNGIGQPTEAALLRAEKAEENAKAQMDDLNAVEEVLKILPHRPMGAEIMCAVKACYMADPNRLSLPRGEMISRVKRVAEEIYVGEATVYRYLRIARDLFASERGLRSNKKAGL